VQIHTQSLAHTMSLVMMQPAKVRGPRQNLRKRNDPARRGSATGSPIVDMVRIPKFIQPNPVRRIKKRWVSTAAFAAQTFTQADLYNQFLVVVATTGNAVPYADMVRIRKIEVYCQGAAGTTFTIQPLNADVSNQFASPERTWTIQCSTNNAPTQSLIKTKRVNGSFGRMEGVVERRVCHLPVHSNMGERHNRSHD
jgi:hypothetical protein